MILLHCWLNKSLTARHSGERFVVRLRRTSVTKLWRIQCREKNGSKNTLSNFIRYPGNLIVGHRVQRKSFLQLAIWASWSQHLLAQALFQLAPKAFWRAELISQFFCYSNSSEKITCPSGKLKAEFNNITPKSTGPGLSDTSFFAPCGHLVACIAGDFVGEYECDWADNCLFPIPFAAQLLFLHTCLLWCQNCQLCR